jgi:hypothetical protein
METPFLDINDIQRNPIDSFMCVGLIFAVIFLICIFVWFLVVHT